MRKLIPILLVLGVLSFGFVTNETQSLVAIPVGLIFLFFAGLIDTKYPKHDTNT